MTLLAIISHPKDTELVRRHWPYFKLPGWPILGCGTEDGQCQWPEQVKRLDTGKLGIKDTPAGTAIYGLIEQELDIWKYCWDHPEYDSVCVVEADNLFVRKPPAEHPGTGYQVTLLPNHAPKGDFSTDEYFSTPRWADRETAAKLYLYGKNLLQRGETEHWMSDRFPALICLRHKIEVRAQPGWSPSVNAQNDTLWVAEARQAIRKGVYCLHAVKTLKQFEALKDLLPCP